MRKTIVLVLVALLLGCCFTYSQARTLSLEKYDVSFDLDVIDGNKELLNGLEIENSIVSSKVLKWTTKTTMNNDVLATDIHFSLLKNYIYNFTSPAYEYLNDENRIYISYDLDYWLWGTPKNSERTKLFLSEQFSDLKPGATAHKDFKLEELTEYLPIRISSFINQKNQSVDEEVLIKYFKIKTPKEYTIGIDVYNDATYGYHIESISLPPTFQAFSRYTGKGFIVWFQQEGTDYDSFNFSEMESGKGIYHFPINSDNEIAIEGFQNIYPLTDEIVNSVCPFDNGQKIAVCLYQNGERTIRTIDLNSRLAIDEISMPNQDEFCYLVEDHDYYLGIYKSGFVLYHINDDGMITEECSYISLESYIEKQNLVFDINYSNDFVIIEKDGRFVIVTPMSYNHSDLLVLVCDKNGLQCLSILKNSLPNIVYSNGYFEDTRYVQGSLRVAWH